MADLVYEYLIILSKTCDDNGISLNGSILLTGIYSSKESKKDAIILLRAEIKKHNIAFPCRIKRDVMRFLRGGSYPEK